MLVRVPQDGGLTIGFLNVGLSHSFLDIQDGVVVLALALLDLELGGVQLLAQTRRLRCELLQLAVLVQSFLPLFLLHLDVTFLEVGLAVLSVESNCGVAVGKGLRVLA